MKESDAEVRSIPVKSNRGHPVSTSFTFEGSISPWTRPTLCASANAPASVRQIEKEMVPLDRRRGRLEQQLAEVTDHRAIATTGAELATVVAAIGALEEQWLELSTEIEERS